MEKVVCPICSKEFKYISFNHIKTHGFINMEVFLKYVKRCEREIPSTALAMG
jgi:hypothetical protein